MSTIVEQFCRYVGSVGIDGNATAKVKRTKIGGNGDIPWLSLVSGWSGLEYRWNERNIPRLFLIAS